jgi:hypothetical protein
MHCAGEVSSGELEHTDGGQTELQLQPCTTDDQSRASNTYVCLFVRIATINMHVFDAYVYKLSYLGDEVWYMHARLYTYMCICTRYKWIKWILYTSYSVPNSRYII